MRLRRHLFQHLETRDQLQPSKEKALSCYRHVFAASLSVSARKYVGHSVCCHYTGLAADQQYLEQVPAAA